MELTSFAWRRLTDKGAVIYRLEDGFLELRGTAAAPPFTTARVRDGSGGFEMRSLDALGLTWEPADDDAWRLRTRGEPQTMVRIASMWGALVRAASAAAGLDERLPLVTIACEAGARAPDEKGFVKAPRTEKGYPRRTGEGDAGDGARDAEDWANFLAKGGIAHSSHGLMQTLISTAYGVRPDLFRNVTPAHYREVLWVPANSIACGVGYMASFSAAVRSDPVAFRFTYGAGSVRSTDGNRWGAILYDEIVPLQFVAFWNDHASVLAHGVPVNAAVASNAARGTPSLVNVSVLASKPAGSNAPLYVAAGAALLVLSAAGVAAYYLTTERA